MELKPGNLVKILGKTIEIDGKRHVDPIGILLHKWDEQLWNILIFNKISTIHSVRIKLLQM